MSQTPRNPNPLAHPGAPGRKAGNRAGDSPARMADSSLVETVTYKSTSTGSAVGSVTRAYPNPLVSQATLRPHGRGSQFAGGTPAPPPHFKWPGDTSGSDRSEQSGDANSITSAGGIGGLLAARDNVAGKNYTYFFDGNGNVVQMIDIGNGSGATIVKYEYDAYGNLTSNWAGGAGTAFPANNPWKFSTKYWDAESGLGYWGYRYYSAKLGRWMSRDPIGEGDVGEDISGDCLFARNGAVSAIDSLGLLSLDQRGDQEGTSQPASSQCADPVTGGANNPCKTESACCKCLLVGESSVDTGCMQALVCIMKNRQALSGQKGWNSPGYFGAESGFCKQAKKNKQFSGGVGDSNYTKCCKGGGGGGAGQAAGQACSGGCPADPTGGAQYWASDQRSLLKVVGPINIKNGNCTIFQVPGCKRMWFAKCSRPPRADGT